MNQDNKIKIIYRIPSSSRPNLIDQKRRLNSVRVNFRFRRSTRRVIWSYFGKHIADLFTFLRLILGLVLLWSGLVDRKAALAQDIWTLVLAWSTDMVDGRISRSLKTDHKTWLGKNDVYVDMFFSVAVLCYMGATNLLPIALLIVYLLLWSAVFIRWGIPTILAQIFQNPIYAYFIFLTVQSAPSVLPWLLLWSLIALLIFWRRLFELLRNVISAVRG